MRAPSLRNWIRWSALSVFIATACRAEDRSDVESQAPPAVARMAGSSSTALSSLQRAHREGGTTFIVEGDLDPLVPEDGGARAPARPASTPCRSYA
jgi:hypothetical protein